jgi:soluble lytic murein transglycosylase
MTRRDGTAGSICLWVGLLVLGCGCVTNSSSTTAGDPNPRRPALGAAAASASASAGPGRAAQPDSHGDSGNWVEAVRMERWSEAARRIDALAARQRDQAEVRYARARAAMALGDHAHAVTLLDGLEKQLVLLRPDIERRRAESQLEAGPYELAGDYFVAHADVAALTNAALAFERAGQFRRAQGAADRALRLAHQRKLGAGEQAQARSIRARVAQKLGKPRLAAADLRWLATVAATSPHARGADERLAQLAEASALSRGERYQRALAFADEGLVEQTEREVELIARAPGRPVSAGDLLHAQAWALYVSRADYARAAELFSRAAKQGSGQVTRDLFYAARARSRAHDDEQALKEYDRLARSYPRSGYAEQAAYLAARLAYIRGDWDDAIRRYGAYLKRYGDRGRYPKSSRYEQAVCWLASGRYAQAAPVFERLARREGDALRLAAYRHLHAVALAEAGDKARASQLFRRTIRDAPLSFAALMSAARLRQQGESPPPLIQPAASGPNPAPLKLVLPAKVALLHRIGLDRDAEAELALHEQQIRTAFGVRGNEAVCQAYAQLSTAERRYRAGRHAASSKALRQAPSAATRWLWECLYPRPYQSLVQAAEQQHRLPPFLVHAVMRQESGFRPAVVSPANAVGLMQLIAPTARRVAGELGIEYTPELLSSPAENIRLGTYYLRKVLSQFGDHPALAAAAYNAGPASVSRWLRSGEKLPLDVFVARIPYRETRYYTSLVIGNLARYAYSWAGPGAVPQLSLDLPRGLRAPADAY